MQTVDIAPGSEILVLSFTRAAVREVKSRLAVRPGNGRLVRPLTFDSFATRFLAQLPSHVAGEEWRARDYDGRIEKAAQVIRLEPEAQQAAGGVPTRSRRRAPRTLSAFALRWCFRSLSTSARSRSSAIRHRQFSPAGFGDTPGAGFASTGFRARLHERHPDIKTTVLVENFRARTEERTRSRGDRPHRANLRRLSAGGSDRTSSGRRRLGHAWPGQPKRRRSGNAAEYGRAVPQQPGSDAGLGVPV